ncbi:MAG: YqiJ family protein [Lentisphaerales bacterium]|nr:YqiJ family protein [Lentisphaerales bacterium]
MINEIFELSKEIYLVPWTVLMIISSIITILSLLSGVGTDLDFDTDVDVDTDLDISLDGGSFFQTFYLFLNVGKVPVTFIIFSIIAINWGLGLIANMIFNPGNYAIVGWIIFAVVFFISLPASKLLTNPLKCFFSKLIEDKESQTHSIGNVCTTVTDVTENSGQASIKEGPTIVNLMVKCEAGQTISKGKKAVVLSKDHSANRYIISEVEDEIFN